MPAVEFCRWKENAKWPLSVFEDEAGSTPDDDDPGSEPGESTVGYVPSDENPLVYHLFGNLQVSDSLVLTEDDYFSFLIAASRDENLPHRKVQRVLSDSALLFLGFRMDDWDYRVLFRLLMSQEGRYRLRRRYKHVAVQIDPEESSIQDPEGARIFLEKYSEGADIEIYWGKVEDFLKELYFRCKEAGDIPLFEVKQVVADED